MVTQHLRLFSFIGASGRVTVWLAEHLALGMPVVVKLLPRELTENPEALERFWSEAAAIARLHSPHVLQVLDQGISSAGWAYSVVELLEGETIESALRRNGSISLPEAVEIIRQTGRVLAKARGVGVRCNDVAPQKVFLVDGEGGPFVKLTDFSLADDTMTPEADATNVAALGNLAWRCLASSPTLPAAVEDWLARAGGPLGPKSFRSVRDLVDALEAALDAVNRGEGDEPVESGEIPLVRRSRMRGPSTEEVDGSW